MEQKEIERIAEEVKKACEGVSAADMVKVLYNALTPEQAPAPIYYIATFIDSVNAAKGVIRLNEDGKTEFSLYAKKGKEIKP